MGDNVKEVKEGNSKKNVLNERLGVNIVSIIVGAIFFIATIAWVDALRALSDQTFHDDIRKKYEKTKKKTISALLVTLIGTFVIIILLIWYKEDFIPSQTEDPHEVEFSDMTSQEWEI